MKRLVVRLAGLALAMIVTAGSPASAETPAGKVYRIGVLSVSARSVENTQFLTLPMLAKFGFGEARNISLIGRYGPIQRMPAMMREILAAGPDVVIAVGGDAIRAARGATTTVPIVIFGPDPVRLGVADSISRPGGNVTGIVILATELDGKRLQLLHEAVPGQRPVAALVNSISPNREVREREMRAVAAAAGIDLRLVYAAGPPDYPAAFAAMRSAGVRGVAIVADPEFYRDGPELIRRAIEVGLPTMCQWSDMAASGCTLSYGPNLTEMRGRLAYYVARILNGAKPADLPIEQPSKVELVVNLETAKALGVAISESIMLRADQIIE